MNEERKKPHLPNFFHPCYFKSLDKGPIKIPCLIRRVSSHTWVRQGKMENPGIIG